MRVKIIKHAVQNWKVVLDGEALSGRWTKESFAELAGRQILDAVRRTERKRSMKVIARKGRQVLTFDSMHEASRVTGADSSNISKAIRGISQSASGYTWEQA